MLNISGSKWITVFKPEIKPAFSEKVVFATISSYKKVFKNEKSFYEYSTWTAKFVGESFEPAQTLRDKDKIDIIRGSISNHYDKENNKVYIDVVIYEFALSNNNHH